MLFTPTDVAFQPKPTNSLFKDLEGQVFGKLKVLGYIGKQSRSQGSALSVWLCRCDCGTLKSITTVVLLRKNGARSCGCARIVVPRTTHGEVSTGKKSPEYRAYLEAKRRCTDVKGRCYSRYGGRGIEFRFNSFDEFLSDVGRRPSPKHTLDRENNDGHYEPGNLRWALPAIQQNNRVDNVHITAKNETHTISEWATITGMVWHTIRSRFIRSGWCGDCSVSPDVTLCPHKTR